VLWIEEWSFANRGVQKWRSMYRTKALKSIDVCTACPSYKGTIYGKYIIVVRK